MPKGNSSTSRTSKPAMSFLKEEPIKGGGGMECERFCGFVHFSVSGL